MLNDPLETPHSRSHLRNDEHAVRASHPDLHRTAIHLIQHRSVKVGIPVVDRYRPVGEKPQSGDELTDHFRFSKNASPVVDDERSRLVELQFAARPASEEPFILLKGASHRYAQRSEGRRESM